MSTIIVRADWDEEAHVWVATSGDIDGLALEAGTVDELFEKVSLAVPELIELNGDERYEVDQDASIHFVASKTGRIAVLQH